MTEWEQVVKKEAHSLVSSVKDLGNDRFALVDQTMWVCQALKCSPPYDFQLESALLGLPSPVKALIMQSSLYELNSVFHFFFKLHGNPHSHLLLSHFIFNPPEKGDMATTVSSLVHRKNVYLVSEECHFFPGKLLTNELASLPAIWGLLPWGTMHAG